MAELLTAGRSTMAGKLPLAPSGRSQLGQTVQVSGAPNPPPGVLRNALGASFRLIDIAGDPHLAHQLTVTGAFQVTSGDTDLADWILRATWASYGWETVADIDLVHGTTFTVYASSLQVAAQQLDFGSGAQDVRVGAFVALGERADSSRPPQRTLRVINSNGADATIAPGQSSQAAFIPNYARDLVVQFQTTPQGAPVFGVLQFRGDNAVIVSEVVVDFNSGFSPPPMPIPNDADTVRIFNLATSTGTMRTPRFIFGLAL
jgi:hypothetical protein